MIHHQPQHIGAIDLADESVGDLRSRLEPALAPARRRVEPGVVESDPGGRGEGDDDLLVGFAELGSARFSVR
ncbi:hypothetical protein NKG94_51745 [Micromonospora sp. M12]